MNYGNIMIFGDSYSTYENYIPAGYAVYYSGHRATPPDVFDVKNTWWGRLMTKTGATLVQNNSWSGSTLGYTGWNGVDTSHTSSFIYRFEKLLSEGFFKENKVDTLFVFGGTNDSWCNAPLGEEKYSDIKREELFSVRPAICYFMARLKCDHPDKKVVFICNCGLKSEIAECMRNAAARVGVALIELENIDKQKGHPTILGMEQICDQVMAGLKKNEIK